MKKLYFSLTCALLFSSTCIITANAASLYIYNNCNSSIAVTQISPTYRDIGSYDTGENVLNVNPFCSSSACTFNLKSNRGSSDVSFNRNPKQDKSVTFNSGSSGGCCPSNYSC